MKEVFEMSIIPWGVYFEEKDLLDFGCELILE